MTETTPQKDRLLTALSAFVLENGLNTASLRPMAKAAGTSDRMLIYHFGSKDGLIAALLERLASDLSEKLDDALPPERAATERQCVRDIVALLRTAPFNRYMTVWHDIVSAAAQGGGVQAEAGAAIVSAYLDWMEKRLPDAINDKRSRAMAILTLIDGVMVMDAVGRSSIADAGIDQLFVD